MAKIAQDIEIVRVCLLLTGAIQGTKNQVGEYLQRFKQSHTRLVRRCDSPRPIEAPHHPAQAGYRGFAATNFAKQVSQMHQIVASSR